MNRIIQSTDRKHVVDSKDASQELTTVTRRIMSGRGQVSVSYSLLKAQSPSQCLVIAHGVGSSANSFLVKYFHSALAAHGFLTVRFNFPYAEGRFRLLRKPDKKDALVCCYRKVVENVRDSQWKPRDIFLGGISLGAAVASHVLSDGPDIPEVKGLFFLGYPLHRPGMPDARGDKHLHKISKPMLFVAGTRDPYTESDALKSTLSALGSKAQVFWLENANHAFDKLKGKSIYSKTLQTIVERIAEWVNSEGSI